MSGSLWRRVSTGWRPRAMCHPSRLFCLQSNWTPRTLDISHHCPPNSLRTYLLPYRRQRLAPREDLLAAEEGVVEDADRLVLRKVVKETLSRNSNNLPNNSSLNKHNRNSHNSNSNNKVESAANSNRAINNNNRSKVVEGEVGDEDLVDRVLLATLAAKVANNSHNSNNLNNKDLL